MSNENETENESDRDIKVTDRRMFDARGELREEYRYLEEGGSRQRPEPSAETRPEPIVEARTEPPPRPAPSDPRLSGKPGAAPAPAAEAGAVGFIELVSVLAEPAAVYLQQAQAAGSGTIASDAKTAQSLEIAKIHIDLLALLETKTAGNLDAQERAMLEDALYQLRQAYVQTRAAVGVS